MNFVAHVVVAHRVAERPVTPFLLGAAAPDLARMARLPVATTGPDELLAGVAVHHRTDAAFHDSAWFRDHNHRLVAELGAHGVRRGPARGAGHVLVELLLDGALLDDEEHVAAFAPAWASLQDADADALAMVDAGAHGPWAGFLDQLTNRLDPAAYADPVYAADRTVGTLSRRPRLAMTDDEATVLRDVAVTARPEIQSGAATVLAEITAAVTR